jgi:hypothetical protein
MAVLLAVYRGLLRLLPRGFYRDFADEMESVFVEILAEAAARGPAAQAQAALRELASLPGEALRLALLPRICGVAAVKARPAGWEGPPKPREILLGLAVFGLPILSLFLPEGLGLTERGPAYLALGLVLGAVLAGVWKGIPRWSLPYLGVALATGTFLLGAQWSADRTLTLALEEFGIVAADGSARLFWEIVWSGFVWLGLFVVAGMALGLLALLNRCRSILPRMRQDWTLASYLLYGGALAALAVSFTQHHANTLYAVASSLCLGSGAWIFLRSPRPWQRSLSLLGGLTLAVLFAAAGRWPVHPLHAWGIALRLELDGWQGPRAVFLDWAWMAAVLLAPGLLRLAAQRRGGAPPPQVS